jgi:hypothetical protein
MSLIPVTKSGVSCISCDWSFWHAKKGCLWCPKFNNPATGHTGAGKVFFCSVYVRELGKVAE